VPVCAKALCAILCDRVRREHPFFSEEASMRAGIAVGSMVCAAALLSAPLSVAAQTLHATLEGYQEVPAVSTKASGSCRAKIDRHAGSIQWELDYGDLQGSALQAHIHFGQHSVNGGVSVFLCTNLGNGPAGTPACPATSASLSGVIVASSILGPGGQGLSAGEFDELVATMRRGVTYVNVHSSLWPGGEIRGQLQ